MAGHEQVSVHDRESTNHVGQRDRAEAKVAAHPLVRMQARIGNGAVARLIAQRQEVPEEEELQMLRDRGVTQRQEVPEEEELQMLRDGAVTQREAQDEEEEEMQMLRGGTDPGVGLEGGPLSDQVSRQIESARGGGSALQEGTRAHMEGAMGADFSAVRVHQDSASDSLARGMTARAFTTGNDIFLRGDVSPGDTSVLAHELTHVVQQTSGRVQSGGDGMTVTPAGDAHEQEADEVSAAVNAGARPALDEDGAH
ncbi:MAG: DUF4157 domain-containing protein [Dehalococcoidia bacterium]|nr:DUF4157 domain-containing protein [Dehalococcoidia bacterium]NUQ56731.1 DUF4157 domain-containing protein [Dehalococcoidia bacterium]